MACTTELLFTLNNNDEPLAKRLRIANNAFNSNELPIFSKESLLLEWFCKTGTKSDNREIWNTLHSCIVSPHLKQMRQNEIHQDALMLMTTVITEKLKYDLDSELRASILQCAIAILKSDLFHQYFKHDMKKYCLFVSIVLLNLDDLNELNDLLWKHLLFSKRIIIEDNYIKPFLINILPSLVDILEKYDDEIMYNNSFRLIQHAIFPPQQDFTVFLNTLFDTLTYKSNKILDTLKVIYISDSKRAKFYFKIIFEAFILSNRNQNLSIYQFFVILINIIGFNLEKPLNFNIIENKKCNLKISLEIIAELFSVLEKRNIIIDRKINEVSFRDFTKKLICSIIRIESNFNLHSIHILKYIIKMDPLIIEELITEILIFVLLPQKDNELQSEYATLMIQIFEMYLKLNRVRKFCEKLLQTLKQYQLGKNVQKKTDIQFIREKEFSKKLEHVNSFKEMFPENVVAYFQYCITLVPNGQMNLILSTFINYLKDTVAEDLQIYAKDSRKTLYLEIVCELLCQFLFAVRVAEHTTAEYFVVTFLNYMNDLKDILAKFGTSILKIEHNHNLMHSFLNVCYTWGEIGILLTYYAPTENVNFQRYFNHVSSVSLPSNITYLHNYLSEKQWSLVAERIKNFGEQPCKYILHKLIIQKLRAVLLFEPKVDEKIQNSIIGNFASNLEISWPLVLEERFIAPIFVPKLDDSDLISLAEHLINDILEKNDFDLLKNNSIIDCREIVTSIFYMCLSKIANLFKKKRKLNDSLCLKPICVRIFKEINSDLFIRKEQVDLDKLLLCFEASESQNVKIDFDKFNAYMEILRNIPIPNLSHDVQIAFFMFLLAVSADLNNSRLENEDVLKKCEDYLIGLVENTSSSNILNCSKSEILLINIIENVNKFKEILSFTIMKAIKETESLNLFKSVVKLLTKNLSQEKYFETSVLTFHIIRKKLHVKNTAENKEILNNYKDKFAKKFLNVVTDDEINDKKIECYVLTLQHYLINDNEDNLAKLIAKLNDYINYAINNINESTTQGSIVLFCTILFNKSKFANISNEIFMKIWKACKELKIQDDFNSELKKMYTSIFDQVENKEFSLILKDLLESSNNSLKTNDPKKFVNVLKIWNFLLTSTLNSFKQNGLQLSLELLLQQIIVYLTNNNKNSFEINEAVVTLEINIISNRKIPQTSNLIDMYFRTSALLISDDRKIDDFLQIFELGLSILRSLAFHRKELLMDRLPPFLQQFRLYLNKLCSNSNADVNLEQFHIMQLTNAAFSLQKLMKMICKLKIDMARLAPFLVADILKQYETITFYPSVKTELDNCLYNLLPICDKHAITYLFRVLSPASTELFKNIYDNFNKYYKFTGKV